MRRNIGALMTGRGIAMAIALGLAALATAAWAQDFPTRAVRMVVPFAPGGPADLLARAVAPAMASGLGQPVVVENRAGVGGVTGVDAVAKATPDGYTIGMSGPGALVAAPYMMKAPYDPARDIAPLARVARVTGVVVVPGNTPYKTLADLVAAARSAPGKLSFGSAGSGTLIHLAGELLNLEAGVNIVHVPYKGGAPATVDLLAGRIQLMFPDLPAVMSQIRAGSIRALAVTSTTRAAALPNVPTTAEAGMPNLLSDSWYGLIAPRGVPAPAFRKLADAALAALKSPEVGAQIVAQGAVVAPSDPQEFSALIADEQRRWRRVIEATGAKME